MRTIKFTDDYTFNPVGDAHSRISKQAGEVYDCSDWVADWLVSRGVAQYHDMRPQETKPSGPSENKGLDIDFEDLPASNLLKNAGYDTLEKVEQATGDELLEINGIGPATLDDINGFFT